MRSHLLAGFILPLLLASAPLQAERPRFGFQGTFSLPKGEAGDFVSNEWGAGLGAHAEFRFGDAQGLVVRADYMAFRGETDTFWKTGLGAPNMRDTFMGCITLGADYTFALTGDNQKGFFLLGGLGGMRVELDTDMDNNSATGEGTSLYFDVGFGYRIGVAVFQIRAMHSSLSPTWTITGPPILFTTGNVSNGTWLNVEAMLRF